MKKVKDITRMVRLFFRLVYEMLRNYPRLNGNLDNNFQICRTICQKIMRSAKIQLEVLWKECVPDGEPFLVVSNHRCFFDVLFLISSVDHPVRFVAAKELLSYPILRKYLKALQCVMIDRYTKDLTKIRESIVQIRDTLQDTNLVLFPEGQCSYYDPQMHRFKKGGFAGVAAADAQVVPAFIHIDEMRNIGRWMIPKGTVTVGFGDGFYPHEVSDKKNPAGELAAYAMERVQAIQEKIS